MPHLRQTYAGSERGHQDLGRRAHRRRGQGCPRRYQDGPPRQLRRCLYWEKAAFEEAEHAAKFAELLGEVLTDSTKENLKMRVDAEYGATAGKTDLAKRAKALNLDAIHDTVHEMARDEARHGKALEGLLNRYFNK